MERKEYFYLNGNTKVGPLSLEALKYAPINPVTLVWNNSLPDWVEARSLPELAEKFAVTSSPPPPPTYSNNVFGNMQSGNYSAPVIRPPMPDNYLVWAILTTVLCCPPFGIASIVNSTKVSSAYAMGDYEGAQKASDNAKKWAMWSAISVAIGVVLYFILIFIFVGIGYLSDNQ
ncbi:MAG: CD225/dispanin family protein [Tannerella sp.]|jgi:hypothetical protein|nr:CD225/dispanin family protein [Tannerella sp.]